ncbi:MAG: DUF1761 domain-containing protein [Bacteroidota bacterium]
MKSGKFWIAVLVCGILANIVDYVVYMQWLGPTYFATNPTLFRQDTSPVWWVIGDFVAVFVFAWVFNRVSSAFGSTVQDGAKAGLYLGIFVSFPTYIFMHLMFNGYPYGLSWISTIYSILWYVVIGALLAVLMKKGQAPSAA